MIVPERASTADRPPGPGVELQQAASFLTEQAFQLDEIAILVFRHGDPSRRLSCVHLKPLR